MSATRSQADLVARPPLQERSLKTQERILNAAEALLAKKPFEAITVAEIVRKARSSVGAFYSRFGSKEGLLTPIYERNDKRLRERMEELLERTETQATSLAELARFSVTTCVEIYRKNRWLMRAMGFHSRMNPEAISDELRKRRTALHRKWGQVFLKHRDEIRHPNPEAAVEFAVYFTAATARDKILFGDAPHASATEVSDAALIEELTRAFLTYLNANI